MILITDVFYNEEDKNAHIAAVGIEDWSSDTIIKTWELDKNGINSDYIPGQFYKRELPCLIELWNHISDDDKEQISTIIIDGFYDIWDGKPGLGHHFRDWLLSQGYTKEVVGVAKSPCRENEKFTLPVYRTFESKKSKCRNALWINGSNMENDYQNKLLSMSGNFRIPTMIKKADKLSRKNYS